MSDKMKNHHRLVQSILQGKLFPGQTSESYELIQTHISSVIVGKEYVYKLKKPLNLGFLDFSTLEKRRFYCNEEIRLNRRLSPQLYVDVLTIYGSADRPSLQQQGEPVDYLLRMKPFDQSAQLDRLLKQGSLSIQIIARFADYIAAFHQRAKVVDAQASFGDAEVVKTPVLENFTQIRSLIQIDAVMHQLDKLESWITAEFARIRDLLQQRKAQGFIRECHGDLHLRNLAWMDEQPLAFDCIEFDPGLYWIDVISDLSFLWMDLLMNQRDDLAWVLLNQYLSQTGDYKALAVLRFYAVYRAMVRAKVAAIGASQTSPQAAQELLLDMTKHLDLALRLIDHCEPTLYLMHGPSGSGKSTLSQRLAAPLQAVILRSDVERKRLYGHAAGKGLEQGIYTAAATQKTYQQLLALSGHMLQQGYSVIVDATFNDPDQRRVFWESAAHNHWRCVILDLKVPESVLMQRINERKNDVSDADVNVLNMQLKNWRPLVNDELRFAVSITPEDTQDTQRLLQLLHVA